MTLDGSSVVVISLADVKLGGVVVTGVHIMAQILMVTGSDMLLRSLSWVLPGILTTC